MIMMPRLPYEKNELAPYISEETMNYHYGKHHMGYVDTLNKLIAWSEFAGMKLEDIVKNSAWAIFNNAAQAWNHSFYWNCLSPNGWGEPTWTILNKIEETFWDFYHFRTVFNTAAKSNFGSGWTWLVETPEWKLKVISTSNADTPLTTENKPLLVIDTWEHAYYIDYKNRRPQYVDAFWNLVNWEWIEV